MTIYNPNIPTGLINLDVDYKNIQNNFSQLNITFGKNHVPFDDTTTNNGKHKFVEMPVQLLPAGLTANEGTVYTKTIGTASQLFYTPDNTGNEYQLTRTITASFALFSNNNVYSGTLTGGWTFLPGGLLLQYGIAPVAAQGTATTIIFPIDFTSTAFSITIGSIAFQGTNGNSPEANNQFVKDGSVTNHQFEVINSSSSSARKIYWQAIGK